VTIDVWVVWAPYPEPNDALPRAREMTLILGIYTNWHAIQVSDRLVRLATAPPLPYDTLANKTVVYFARRGVLSISFTGIAYIGRTPTDQWVAEKLSGIDLSSARGTAFGHEIAPPTTSDKLLNTCGSRPAWRSPSWPRYPQSDVGVSRDRVAVGSSAQPPATRYLQGHESQNPRRTV
jgi:hypothetical protein